MSSSDAEQTSRRPRTPSRRPSSLPGPPGRTTHRATRRPGSSPPAWRRFIDLTRAESSRTARETTYELEPPQGPTEHSDDALSLYFYCAHPSLSPSAAVALTLRAVGGLTTKQIAAAYLVPEATMAQRITRAKRALVDVPLDSPGDLPTVLRTLYLVFNEGYTGDVDLSAEAIRLTRQIAALTDHPETHGLLALMLLHHARRAARTDATGALVTLPDQDRTLWDTDADRRGRRRPPDRSRPRPPRRVPGPGRHRRPARRRHVARRDRLGPDRRVVRRAAGAHRQPGRPPQPSGGRRRGRRRPGRPARAGRGARRRTAAHRRRGVPARESRATRTTAARLYADGRAVGPQRGRA